VVLPGGGREGRREGGRGRGEEDPCVGDALGGGGGREEDVRKEGREGGREGSKQNAYIEHVDRDAQKEKGRGKS